MTLLLGPPGSGKSTLLLALVRKRDTSLKVKGLQASSVAEKRHNTSTDYILKVLGLDVYSETFVGNDMLRVATGKVLALELPKHGNETCTVLYLASAKASHDLATTALESFKNDAKKMVVALEDMERVFVPP
ncbi:hypothetical protein L2E82_14000 [Cichorium intybus]|uniref:Uncharacterized protein n=1 Tax=Cichorium intybus TaxID=13427 RepID=A0ACB9EZE4_CICIN|nr:hypothetical protein L2E82_14000 [Cichorium intybus]